MTGAQSDGVIWADDFSDGFATVGPQARWGYFQAGPFVAQDGIATTSEDGLQVVSSSTNPRTGEPAFAATLGHEQDETSPVGALDHVKWLVYANHEASSGYPGFDAVPGEELTFETWFSGRTYGTGAHPFGGAVADAEDDLRLASVAMPVLDAETNLVLDFFVTNKRIYLFYERLPHARGALGDYAAFLYTIPVGTRSPDDQHHFTIAYDPSAGVARWLVDGAEVYRVDRLGCRLVSSRYLMLDHGGVETEARPRQFGAGLGLFTILDGAQPEHHDAGLVRLTPEPDHYFSPARGAPRAQSFCDEMSLAPSRLFGQGAMLRVAKYVVSRTPVR
jgi:hypothetical protein